MYNEKGIIQPSFSLKNRLGRLLWLIIDNLLFKLSPRPFYRYRNFLLRLFGAKIGNSVRIYPKVVIWAPWNLEIGSQTAIANGVILYTQGKITIGNKTVVSQGSHLCAGTHDYTHRAFPLITKDIIIGNDVWIAAEVFIHPGVIIGDGTVIGARSVVTKNMPSWMVCSGFPCVPIKVRQLRD
jgi:putative colanic acid biosynthesis acetyltransferase WcaF